MTREQAVTAETPDSDPRTSEQSDNHSLAREMRVLADATDGDVAWGHIVEVAESRRGENVNIVVELDTPSDEYRVTFTMPKPKPPLEDYELTQVAEEYGRGLTDITALEGTDVPLTYDGTTGSWSLGRSPDRSERMRLHNFAGWVVQGPVFIPMVCFAGLADGADDFSVGVLMATASILFWCSIIAGFILLS